ncbi:MAG: hypothetical protein LIP09_09785 [Bacteroidales bacterium]|nr:hypothetical protein [Bacteroidales bacterium]
MEENITEVKVDGNKEEVEIVDPRKQSFQNEWLERLFNSDDSFHVIENFDDADETLCLIEYDSTQDELRVMVEGLHPIRTEIDYGLTVDENIDNAKEAVIECCPDLERASALSM